MQRWLARVAFSGLIAGSCAPAPLESFDTRPISHPQATPPVRVSSATSRSDEDAAAIAAADGSLRVAWSSNADGRVDLVWSRSSDGRSWSTPRAITRDAAEDYYPALLGSPDGFELVWFRLDRTRGWTDVYCSRSADARVWSEPLNVSRSGQGWAPSPYRDASGDLCVVWSADRGGERDLLGACSLDRGRHWSEARELTSGPDQDDFPHVLVRRSGELVLTWTRYRPGSRRSAYFRDASAEIVLSTSRDGRTWSHPRPISPADPDSRYVDFAPHAFESHDGDRLFVTWTSSRSDRRGDIVMRQISAQETPIHRLTETADPDYGGKVAATRNPGEFLLVWTGTRGGRHAIWSRRFVP